MHPRHRVPTCLALSLALLLAACAGNRPEAAPACGPASLRTLPELPEITDTSMPATTTPAERAAATQPREVAEFRLLLDEAAAGNPDSQMRVAERYLAGNGTWRNLTEAHRWLRQATAREFAPAMDLLSTLHYRGIGVPVNYPAARTLMECAVEHRYLTALNNLAWFLATCPDDDVRDGRRAIALLEPAMDQSAQMLDTLAAAYAETGDFDHAGELQHQAILSLDSEEDPRLGAFVQRLLMYRRGLPWRDPPPAVSTR